MAEQIRNQVRLRVHLASSPEKVFETLASGTGRASFWADQAEELDGSIHFIFSNGMQHQGRILENKPPRRFAVEYFGGSRADFELQPDGTGGTLLTLTESGIPAEWYLDQHAGWVTVLLALKGAVDFGIDLRNPHPEMDWEHGFVDV